MKKKSQTRARQSGSYLPYRESKYYFLFCRIEGSWYLRWQKGFNHVSLVRKHGKHWIIFEPILGFCFLNVCNVNEFDRFVTYDVLEVNIRVTNRNRLIRPIFQTCVTFVQYIAGISTGAILCQTLYDRLINCQLEGVKVKKWEPQL